MCAVIKIPLTVFTAVVSARVLTDHFNPGAQPAGRPTTRQTQPEKYILKNDPQCGLPAGGTNCELDCEQDGDVYKNPACLRDCSISTCFALLMEDYTSHNGVCNDSVGHIMYNWTASDSKCQLNGVEVADGLCSNQTIQALIQPQCINSIFSLPYRLSNTITSLIRSLCRHEVHDLFSPRSCGLECANTMTAGGWVEMEDSSCLSDCDCTQSLYIDYYHAGGVCAWSFADVQLNWPVSSKPCQIEGDITNTITSPNYPNNYPNSITLYYYLTAPAGQSVQLQFTTFVIDTLTWTGTCDDWVMILDSEGQCGPLSLVEIQRGLALIGQELHSVAAPVSLMP